MAESEKTPSRNASFAVHANCRGVSRANMFYIFLGGDKTPRSHFYMTITEMKTMLRDPWGLQGRLSLLYLETASTVFKTINKVIDRMSTDKFDLSITSLDTKILYCKIVFKAVLSLTLLWTLLIFSDFCRYKDTLIRPTRQRIPLSHS